MNAELLEKLENLKVTLKEEGYKDWCYAMLTIDEAIKAVKTIIGSRKTLKCLLVHI